MMARSLLFLLIALASANPFTCPATFSNGPCFTSAKNWTEAQQVCEAHGSNLATILDATANSDLGQGGCFSAAPWNDWKCSWVGLNDLRTEGTYEWSGGSAFSYSNWGQYEPDSTSDNVQDCTAVCNGGTLDGYSGDFWVDLECDSEYAFCCDPATFNRDAGTAPEESYLASLPAPSSTPSPADPDPYEDRRLCFSTQQTWPDAQKLCSSLASNLITIHNRGELDHLGRTVAFSRVPASWGLDWQCVWAGYHDRGEEGNYEWVSRARPGYTPEFGPFEAGNGDGESEDCVALCKSACSNSSDPSCMDLAGYGYIGTFAIDTACTDEYSFCCDGLAAEYVALGADAHQPSRVRMQTIIIILAIVAGVAALVACVAIYVAIRARRAKSATPTLKTMGSASDGSGMTMYSPPVQAEGSRA